MKKFNRYLSSALGLLILVISSLFGGDGVSPVVDTEDKPAVNPFEPVIDPVIDEDPEPVVPTDNSSVCEPSRRSSPWQKPIYYGRSKSKGSSSVGGGRVLRRLFGR